MRLRIRDIFVPISIRELALTAMELGAAIWLHKHGYVWTSGAVTGACLWAFISRRMTLFSAYYVFKKYPESMETINLIREMKQ